MFRTPVSRPAATQVAACLSIPSDLPIRSTAMLLLQQELARARSAEARLEAERSARAARVASAQRWQKRARRAQERSARANERLRLAHA
jgi:uncharacterized protein YlxW (UPF0749 family)